MQRSTVVASVLLVLTATAATGQESVLLRIGGQVGQYNKYQTVMETFMRPGGQMAQMMSSDTTLPFMRMTMNMTRTLTGIAGDTLTFTEVIDSARMETPAMPQMSAMMGGAAGMLQGQTTTQHTDGRGRIFSSEVTGGMAGMMGGGGMGGGGMGGGGMGGRGGRGPMGGMGAMNRTERPVFLLPARAVRVGETWTDTTSTPGTGPNNEGASALEATFRLDRVEMHGSSRVAVVSLNGNQVSVTPQGQQRFSVSGQFQIDLTGSRMVGADMTLSGTVQGREGPTPVRMHVTQALVP